MHANQRERATAEMVPGGSQEKALGVRVLKEVEELAVSKLEAAQQSASSASCQAAKQFLHEEPYEQVLLCPWSSLSVQPFMFVQPLTPVIGAGMCLSTASQSQQSAFPPVYGSTSQHLLPA